MDGFWFLMVSRDPTHAREGTMGREERDAFLKRSSSEARFYRKFISLCGGGGVRGREIVCAKESL